MDEVFGASAWLGALVWASASVLNWMLLLWGARLYRDGASAHWRTEGSYAAAPEYEADVERGRFLSAPFMVQLVGFSIGLPFLQWFASDVGFVEPYLVVLGALLLPCVPIQLLHARNLHLFRALNRGEAGGSLIYPRRLGLRSLAVEMGYFTVLYALWFAMARQWLALGGSLACGSTAFKYWRRARREGQPDVS